MPLGSWYSQLPAFGWFDPEDRPGSAAYRVGGRSVPDSQQGIALPTRGGLGKWYNITPPGSDRPMPFQQTDIGPAPYTGRGIDISAAAAHQMGYTPKNFPTEANFKAEPIDLTGLGLAAGWGGGVPGDNQTAVAEGPRGGARKMPNSLMDMFQPRSLADNEPIGIGDAIAQNRQSLVGLGMGLLTPRSLAVGAPAQSAWSNALGGYAQGAQADSANNYRQQQIAHLKRQEAFQREQAAFQREQTNITDAQRAMKDVLGAGATPEQKAAFMQSYYASKTDPGGWVLKDIIDPNDPEGERKITVQEHNRTGQIRPPQLPGQISTAAAAPDPFAAGATPQPVYGQGGNFSTPPVGAPAAPAAAPRHAITLPSGEVVTPPPGLSKKGREAWATDVAKTAADMQTGKMTEAQAKYSIYATGMEIAQRELQGLEGAGTSPGTRAEGKGLGGLPWGIGAFFQSNEYQNYRNAKDAWLNAKLRAESGATINPDEFARDDRIYFPQPGEGPEQVAAKKKLREQITKNMTRAGGPGYQSPPTVPTVTPAAPTAGGGATFNERFSGGGNAPPNTRTGGAALPAPPPGFQIVR